MACWPCTSRTLAPEEAAVLCSSCPQPNLTCPFCLSLCPQPLHVVCPEQYTQPPPAQSHRMDLMVDCQPPPMAYRRAEVLALPFKRRYEKIEIMPEVSAPPLVTHPLLLGSQTAT